MTSESKEHMLTSFVQEFSFISPGGNYHILYTGKGCAILWGASLRQKVNFRVSFLVRSQQDINSSVDRITLYDIEFDLTSYT